LDMARKLPISKDIDKLHRQWTPLARNTKEKNTGRRRLPPRAEKLKPPEKKKSKGGGDGLYKYPPQKGPDKRKRTERITPI